MQEHIAAVSPPKQSADSTPDALPKRLAQPSQARGPVLPRLDVVRLRQYLPRRQAIRIEINGVLAGVPCAVPDAVREFAIGWAYMNRFFSDADQLGTITATESHVSVMIEGGEDLDRLKYESIGWIPRADLVDAQSSDVSERQPKASPVMSEMDAVASSNEAFARFERDGANVGYRHAALVTTDDVVCVARDLESDVAMAKVLGWAITSDFDFASAMLVLNGVVDAPAVEAAGRIGIGIVSTDAVPTHGAVDVATRSCTSLLGLVRSHRRGLFVDGGHLCEDVLNMALDEVV